MKKVLVLTVAIALLAAPAFAGIRNTKHDLSTTSTSGGSVISTNYTELCVFCHTPHGAVTGLLAPLWNRTGVLVTYAATDLYNNTSLEAGSAPTTVLAEVNASDAKLCLSCHDGTSLAGNLKNPANSSAGAQPTFNASPADAVGIAANLGASLNNDHPIGMNYNTVQGTDGGLNVADAGGFVLAKDGVNELPLYGANTVMWCSSCHDVHDNSKGAPFLNTSNAGSALCLSCHNK